MHNILSLKKRVMARIYIEYLKSIFIEHPDYLMLLVFIVTSFMLVSIHDVVNNLPKDSFPRAFSFFVVALRNTSWFIQALIAGFLIRVAIAGSKITYKNFKNLHINTDWILAKFRY